MSMAGGGGGFWFKTSCFLSLIFVCHGRQALEKEREVLNKRNSKGPERPVEAPDLSSRPQYVAQRLPFG